MRRLTLFLLAAVTVLAQELPLRYAQLELLDGRTLKHAVIKSYDPSSERVLIFAENTALSVPLTLLPPPAAEQVRTLYRGSGAAGRTTSIVATRPSQPPASNTGATRVVQPTRPAPVPAPVAPAGESAESLERQRHQTAALEHARKYFQYKYKTGSDAIAVTSLDFDAETPEAVSGWTGRFRTKGQAYLEFYDSRGRSFSRTTRKFEVLTEAKEGKDIEVVDFTTK